MEEKILGYKKLFVNYLHAKEIKPILGRLIISDIERHTLIAYNLQSKQQETIASDGIGTIVGMDFDHIGNNLFWVDEELQTVEVMNLKTYARATLVRNFGTEIPMDIALNLEDGYVIFIIIFYFCLFKLCAQNSLALTGPNSLSHLRALKGKYKLLKDLFKTIKEKKIVKNFY